MTKSFLDFAEEKYEAYNLIDVDTHPNLIDVKAVLGFEAVERYLKHMLCSTFGEAPKTHNLSFLAKPLNDKQLFRAVAAIKDIYYERNYPDDAYYEYDSEDLELLRATVDYVRQLVISKEPKISNRFQE